MGKARNWQNLPMFRKSFVSIYFLPDRLLLFQLSHNKRKVTKYGQVILPPGLIKENRIQDIKGLAKVVSSAWQKFHIKEKTVGITLPEFSTFTKYFKLPALSISDLDEAVRWQAQEYLPTTAEKIILDWKITKKEKNGYEVMMVAVEKEVLTEYVATVEEAGLFPLMVETPSICLLRFSKKEEGGVLMIYRDIGEFILVLSEGEKIIGSSTQQTSDFDEVVGVASKMINHYSDTKVTKVLVGGEGSADYIEAVKSTLKTEVSLVDPDLDGISKEDIQKNLIPLSLQYEDPDEPSSPTTLNLLPSTLVEKYKFERLKLQMWSLTLTITLFVWISFFVTLGSYFLMVQNINDLKESEVPTSLAENTEKNLGEIKSINEVSKRVLEIKKITVVPQVILNYMYTSAPLGVVIGEYDLNLDSGEIRVLGTSADRVTLIQFKENLESVEEIGSVEIPISSFEEETNLDFSLSFLYLPISSTLKEKEKVRKASPGK